MLITVPCETLEGEHRVGLTPAGAEDLLEQGHQVLVEKGPGQGSALGDKEYLASGAKICGTQEAWSGDLVVKVKDPQPDEFGRMSKAQVIFTYFHFAASKKLFEAVRNSCAVALAYETITSPSGELPLLTPMSQIAGRMAIQVGAHYLERGQGGRGVLLSGVPGTARGQVVIVGAGVVGVNAARIAAGMGARVTLMDVNLEKLRQLEHEFPANVEFIYASREALRQRVRTAHLLVGAVLVRGAKAPVVVDEAMVKTMKKGSVIVDVAIDQGGCVATSNPTHHENPVFEKHGVLHYGVTNMPGAVARTSTRALASATLPYVERIARLGLFKACEEDGHLSDGINLALGKAVHPAVAKTFGLEAVPWREALKP